MEPVLTICISTHNDSDFVLNTLLCLEKITKNNFKVIIRDNDSDLGHAEYLRKNTKKYKNVYLYRVENLNLNGSMAHGTSLNDLYNKINTRYGAIIDADFTFLHKNWDEILINELDEKCPIIGTQGPSFKYQDFPYVFALFFYTDIFKKLNIDLRPGDVFNDATQDTGFRVRENYLARGYKGKLLVNKYTGDYKSGPFRNINCQEFYLKGYDNIFASHFWRGSSYGAWKYFVKYRKMINRAPIIGKSLLKLTLLNKALYKIARFKGKFDKKKWLKICRKIVNDIE
ncbi:MAG: glycosyltransferase [Candidatus Hodarchaeota archaeon]